MADGNGAIVNHELDGLDTGSAEGDVKLLGYRLTDGGRRVAAS